MKWIRYIGMCSVWLGLGGASVAQGFINLDFERATIPPTPAGQFGPLRADPALAFPGWTMGPNGTSAANITSYNNLTLGSVAQVLIGPNQPNAIHYTPLQGSYSALLQFGPSEQAGTPALSQIGVVPADARSINFLASTDHDDARVTLNGLDIPLTRIGGGRLAGDVSAFAGRQVELTFSTKSYGGKWLYFDDVVFSPVTVPEPSVGSLAAAGAVFWLWNRAKRSNVPPAA